MRLFRTILPVVAVVALLPLSGVAQESLPLAPNAKFGQPVAPFVEGWFQNPDGTFTVSLGYFNLNTEEVVEIPIGENNFIEPAQFNGMQPTSFPGRRNQGVFTVTMPADLAAEGIVWTIKHRGHTLSVPARAFIPSYELGYLPMASGSLPPNLRFAATGENFFGVTGKVDGEVRRVAVGQPLPLQIWFDDLRSQREPVPLNVQWFKHQGPVGGVVTFEPEDHEDVETGEALTNATFSLPGEYVVRVRVDNHNSNDSSPGDQCCWSNGYIRVQVSE